MALRKPVLETTWDMLDALDIQYEDPNRPGYCDCKPVEVEIDGEMVLRYPMCEHMANADHNLSCERWAELLSKAAPKLYNDPPLPPTPEHYTCKKDRVETMRWRYREVVDKHGNLVKERYHIWHPDDSNSDEHLLGRVVKPGVNGRAVEVGPWGLDLAETEEDYYD